MSWILRKEGSIYLRCGGDRGLAHFFFNAIHSEVLGLVLCAMQISFILAKLSEVHIVHRNKDAHFLAYN